MNSVHVLEAKSVSPFLLEDAVLNAQSSSPKSDSLMKAPTHFILFSNF